MTKFLKFALIASASAAAISSASAADLPSTKGPPVMPALAIYNWTGFYVGLNIGGGWVADDVVGIRVNPPGLPFLGNLGNAKGSGLTGGAQLGYNWQRGNWVFGVEADIQASGIRDRFTVGAAGAILPVPPPGVGGGLVGPVSVRAEVDWYATFRGRLGYAWDRTLIYVTGGGAVTDVNYRITDAIGPVIRDSDTIFHWTAGAGIEYAFWNRWSAKLEYLYVSAGRETLSGGLGFSTEATQGFHNVRVGVNYRW